MIRNYFLFSYRQMLRHKLFSFISLTGLSFGMACFLLIFLYLQYQYSYDQYHEKKERIFRVNRYHDGENGQQRLSTTAAGVADFARVSLSEVESIIRFSNLPLVLHTKDKKIKEKNVYAVDPEFFNVFSFKLLKGDPQQALLEPNSIILTEEIAQKIFGREEALDQTIFTYDSKGNILPLKVTGILKDVPSNSHQHFKVLLSFNTLNSFVDERWKDENWYGCLTYLLLKENASPDKVEEQLNALTKDLIPDFGFQTSKLKLQSLTSIFFNPMKDGWSQRGSKEVTYVLLILGILILLIASLNYINLSTARSMQRITEIGVRKVHGANKIQLIGQFLGESIFFSMLSLIIAIFLLLLFIPAINQFSNLLFTIHLDANLFNNAEFLGVAFGTAVVTGILSGLYPAFVLSGFQTGKALKGKTERRGSTFTRKALVVIQYIVSICMIFGSIAILKLFNHMRTQDLGFNKENVIVVNLEKIGKDEQISYFKNQLLRIPGVGKVAGTSRVPLSLSNELSYYFWDSKENKDKRIPIIYVDRNFFDLLNIELVDQPDPIFLLEDVEKEIAVVNQAFVAELSDQHPLGSVMEVYNLDKANERMPVAHPELIGSYSEFVESNIIMNKPTPWVIILSDKNVNYMLVKISEDFNENILGKIENSFYQIFPDHVFEYSFIDDEINTVLNIFSPFVKLIFFGTFFAIFIASMGLFALSLYITQQRTREVGIRKVFGANEKNITYLLTTQFIRLVIIAFIIAGPITFWGFRFLFQILPNKIEMGWHILGIVAFFIVGLGVMTVWVQSFKSARTNPVETLRYE